MLHKVERAAFCVAIKRRCLNFLNSNSISHWLVHLCWPLQYSSPSYMHWCSSRNSAPCRRTRVRSAAARRRRSGRNVGDAGMSRDRNTSAVHCLASRQQRHHGDIDGLRRDAVGWNLLSEAQAGRTRPRRTVLVLGNKFGRRSVDQCHRQRHLWVLRRGDLSGILQHRLHAPAAFNTTLKPENSCLFYALGDVIFWNTFLLIHF